MIVAKCVQAGQTLTSLLVIFLACASFHFCTLEEYYTGGLFLGDINGITEGSFLIFGIFIAMGIKGNDFWLEKATETLTYSDLFAGGICVVSILQLIISFKGVIDHSRKKLQPGDLTGEPFVMSEFILNIVGYFIPAGLLLSLAYIGKDPMISY
jgi:hypothetical protein